MVLNVLPLLQQPPNKNKKQGLYRKLVFSFFTNYDYFINEVLCTRRITAGESLLIRQVDYAFGATSRHLLNACRVFFMIAPILRSQAEFFGH